MVCANLNEWISCLSFFLVPSQSSSTPLYPRSATSQGACPDSLLFRCFHFRLTFESIKELGSAPPLGANNDSHHPNYVNFSHPWVTIPNVEPNIVDNVHMQEPPSNFSKLLPLVSHGGLKLKGSICIVDKWRIKHCPPNSEIQYFSL